MKYLLPVIILGLAIFVLVSGTPVAAQQLPEEGEETPTETESSEVKVALEVGTQSPWNGKIPVTLKYKSNINGQKAQVIWKYPSYLKGELPDRKFYPYQKDQVYSLPNKLDPEKPGTYTLVVDVIVWGNDSNYVNTDQVTITIDESLLVTPQTSAYRNAVMIRYAVLAVGGILALLALVFAIKKLAQFIPRWLESEVNKAS